MEKLIKESDYVQFNLFRENNLNKTFKRDEIRYLLKKQMNWPSSSKFLTAITSGVNPPIIKVKYGVYAVNQKPVDKERLQTVFDEYVKLNYIHFVKYKKKKISIEQAIYVLKNAGYKVLKPVTQYEEA